jgi:CHAT domain-containing protein
MRRRHWLAAVLGWAAARRAAGQAAAVGPAATDWMAWAEQRRAAGDAELAVWLAKRALADWPAADDAVVALHRQLAAWLAEDGRAPEAREIQARAHAAALAAFVDDPADPVSQLPPVAWRPLESAWSRAWPAGPVAAADLPARWADLRAMPRPRDLPRPTRPRAAPGEVHLHAVGSPLGLSLWIDDGRSVEGRLIAWPLAQRERELGHLLQALARPRAAPPLAALQALYQRLGAPLDRAARAVGAHTVVLQLDGPLRELPWAALHDGQAWLGERYAFRQAVAGLDPAPVPDGPLRLLALGTSQAAAGQSPLPGVAAEVCAIVDGPVHGLGPTGCSDGHSAGVVPGEAWLDSAFTGDQLARVVSGRLDGPPVRGLLHLGTHFDLRPGRMARSTLLLGNGQRWPLSQVAELDFSGQMLVALAACETGSAGADAAHSLQALVLQRGARAVLASLWRVGDGSTAALMQAFYRHLGQAGPAQALRQAQQAVRAHAAWRSPFHWAGFVLSSRS